MWCSLFKSLRGSVGWLRCDSWLVLFVRWFALVVAAWCVICVCWVVVFWGCVVCLFGLGDLFGVLVTRFLGFDLI